MSGVGGNEKVFASMRANRARGTKPELALLLALRATGRSGYRRNRRVLPGTPDVSFPRQMLAIFVHGCFWHRCPHCQLALPKSNQAFWIRKFELNAERDERKHRQLEALGWEVLEVWECEVKRDAAACAALVGQTLKRIEQHVEADEEIAELRGSKRTPVKRGTRGRA